MRIERCDYITAPAGDAIHTHGQCYTAPAGEGMIEWVVHHAFDGKYYYTRKLYRRLSNDGGRTWSTHGPAYAADPSKPQSHERLAGRHVLDARSGLLVAIYSDWQIKSDQPQFASQSTSASYRVHYEISRDQGNTWTAPRQVIHRGPGFDAVHWMPGITYGRNGGYVESCPPAVLNDGTIVVGMVVAPLDAGGKLYRPGGAGYWYNTVFLRGRWNTDRTALEWESSAPLAVATDVSSVGICEPDLVGLGGDRLFATMRCQGDRGRGIASSRQAALSADGGRTWTTPSPLTYDDGGPVYVPAAYSTFLRSPRTGKIYWFANILDHPVCAQYPRCPLSMAEFDPQRLCLIRDSVQVVQGLPPGAPPCTNELPTTDEECGRQYTNFGAYVDRQSGEMVILVSEMPKSTWREFTSDSIQIRIGD